MKGVRGLCSENVERTGGEVGWLMEVKVDILVQISDSSPQLWDVYQERPRHNRGQYSPTELQLPCRLGMTLPETDTKVCVCWYCISGAYLGCFQEPVGVNGLSSVSSPAVLC